MSNPIINEAERHFLSRYAVRGSWGFRWRHPKGTPANLAMVESLEKRGLIKRKVQGSGFVNFELTREGRTAMDSL